MAIITSCLDDITQFNPPQSAGVVVFPNDLGEIRERARMEYKSAHARRRSWLVPLRKAVAQICEYPNEGHLSNPFTRLPMTSRASFSGIRPLSNPRSASTVTSWSVTVTVPSIGVLNKPHFAVSEKVSTDPCQLRCLTSNRTGNPGACSNISSNERSTVFMTSALELLCEIVIRMFRPRTNSVQVFDRR